MKRSNYFVCFFSVFLISVFLTSAPAAASSFDISQYSGPKMKDLYYVIIRDMDARLLAMSAGKLDVLSDIYRPVDVERLLESGTADLSLASTFHGMFVTFNTRKFPWNETVLRQAASQASERKKWTRDLFSGYCEPMTGFLPVISPFYEKETTAFPPGAEAARKRLSDAGWTWNGDGWLVAPDGRELPMTNILCPPSSVAATTTEIATLMAETLVSIGVPARAVPIDFQTMLARVDVRDFDACTNAWSMSRDPDVLYSFYHSSMDVEGGYNLSGIADPELDGILHELRYAPDEAAAREYSSRAQKMLSDLMPVIPIYSRYSISAMQTGWDGIFLTDRNTADNLLTLISMTPREGGPRPIYWNIPEEIRTLNPLVSSSAYDWMVLGTIYDTLISVDPYTFEDMPWLAESWDISPGEKGSVLTFTLKDGLKWQDGHPLTVEDAAYSIQFIKDNSVPRFYDSVKDIESIETDVKNRRLRIAMANTSYWHLHNIGGGIPLLPKHILENVKDWRAWQPSNTPHKALDGSMLTELIGTGPFTFRESRTGEYVHMTRNEHYMLRTAPE